MFKSMIQAGVAAGFALGAASLHAQRPACAPDDAGLTLPDGFCALIVADEVGQVRHLAVAANGDVFAALNDGGFVLLRDTDGDGAADVERRYGGDERATGIALHDGFVYFAPDDAIYRYPWTPGSLEPAGEREVVASGLYREGRWHSAKGFAITTQGDLFVNIGVPSNACQVQRGAGNPGHDPCPLLEMSGAVWRLDANRTGQRQQDGVRFATGLRNTFALAIQPSTQELYGAQHGRDGLHQMWPQFFSEVDGAEKPAEEFVRIREGDDYGWPYCYFDPIKKKKVLAPEYGGDGERVGRCAEKTPPVFGFPGHWAPEAIVFYAGTQFPSMYRGGAFISFHGSWNRAPQPQAGYNVAFMPFEEDRATGEYTVFADGFAGPDKSPNGAQHRPTGLAVGPDGSLYIGDDTGGRIYRVMYRR